jgi:hypothetical protein
LEREGQMPKPKLPNHIIKFLAENFPTDEDLAGYVICIAKRDKTLHIAQGYDSSEVRDKVLKEMTSEVLAWTDTGNVT